MTLPLRTALAVLAALLLLGSAPVEPRSTSFHFMQIEQVIAGVDGDLTAQAIQLRMRSRGQRLLGQARMRAFDAQGQNPILLINFTSSVTNGAAGSRVLIATPTFLAKASPAISSDFALASTIPPSYLQAGSLTFESNGGIIYWRLSWGGAGYTGATTGSITNDNDGEFGPPWPGRLPSARAVALQFQGTASAISTTNAADYARKKSPTFTNNGGFSTTVSTSLTRKPLDASGRPLKPGGSRVALGSAGSVPSPAARVRNGSGVNALRLHAAETPRLGRTWSVDLDCGQHSPGLAVVIGTGAAASGSVTRAGELLIELSGSSRLLLALGSHGGGEVTFDLRLPDDPQLLGLEASLQAVCLGAPGPELSNALDIVLGR